MRKFYTYAIDHVFLLDFHPNTIECGFWSNFPSKTIDFDFGLIFIVMVLEIKFCFYYLIWDQVQILKRCPQEVFFFFFIIDRAI